MPKPIVHFCRCGRYADEYAKANIAVCKCHTKDFDKVALADCPCGLETMCYCKSEDSADHGYIGHIECLACGRRWNRAGPEDGWKPDRNPKTAPSGRRHTWMPQTKGYQFR